MTTIILIAVVAVASFTLVAVAGSLNNWLNARAELARAKARLIERKLERDRQENPEPSKARVTALGTRVDREGRVR